MITFFYELTRKLKGRQKLYWKLAYKVNKCLINLLFPLSQRRNSEYGLDENGRMIVSMTTYPERLNTVWITVASLLNQTVKPYKVILWLAEEQFQEVRLPRRLVKLQERGLEIRFCEDLKPHKKYFYTMQEYSDYYVVTADDDIFYPENHLEKLWKGHERYPEAVICHWSHKIMIEENGSFAAYNDWPDNTEEAPSYLTLAVGCNGVLYPPHSLPMEAFNKEKICETALYTDDLWLKCMEIMNQKKVVNCNKNPLIYFNIVSAQKTGLWKKNTGSEARNEKVWSSLMQQYPEIKKCLMEVEKEKGNNKNE